MPRALLFGPLLALFVAPAAAQTYAPVAAQTCAPALVAEAGTGAVHLSDGRVFLPEDPQDAADLLPGDVVFACDDHLREIETFFPIPGQWQPQQT
jgi:hypothetical protein